MYFDCGETAKSLTREMPYVVLLSPKSLLSKQAFATEPSFPLRGCEEQYGPKVPTWDHKFTGQNIGRGL